MSETSERETTGSELHVCQPTWVGLGRVGAVSGIHIAPLKGLQEVLINTERIQCSQQ